MTSMALREPRTPLRSDLWIGAAIELAERGWLPDLVIRAGIRRFIRERLDEQEATGSSTVLLAERLRGMPIAVEAAAANDQHYEVPAAFFAGVLGRRLKYSCAHWGEGVATLDQAEEAMLALTAERAGVEDGMEVLDLGCGWGSFALWLAARQPRTRVVAVSNSATQGRFIAERATRAGLTNVEVVRADVNRLILPQRFDRVVSVEMFEHARNYRLLLERVAGWLRPHGQLFVHIFCHRRHAYLYETDGASNWMARHFFTGGTMPSFDLFEHFSDDLRIEARWWVAGTHYARTAEAWLANLDRIRDDVAELFRRSADGGDVDRIVQRWRLFFLACAEMFAFADGEEWGVGHYRFVRHGK